MRVTPLVDLNTTRFVCGGIVVGKKTRFVRRRSTGMAVRGSETLIMACKGRGGRRAASFGEEKGEMDDVVGTP